MTLFHVLNLSRDKSMEKASENRYFIIYKILNNAVKLSLVLGTFTFITHE
jgi:hypothetical protein